MPETDGNGQRIGPCEDCGIDHDDAVDCEQAWIEAGPPPVKIRGMR